jgi:outer membrane protein TolC
LITIEKAAYQPTFFAFGTYLLYKDDSPLMDMTPDWIAGVGVKFNLLSREGKSEKIAAAKLLKNRLTHTLNQAQNDLTLLVEKTYKEMLQYKQEYEDLSSSLNLAKENLRLRQLAFKEGLATSVDVVDAQMFLTGAKTKRLNAIYNYVQKISQLSVLSGNSELFFELEQTSMEIK